MSSQDLAAKAPGHAPTLMIVVMEHEPRGRPDRIAAKLLVITSQDLQITGTLEPTVSLIEQRHDLPSLIPMSFLLSPTAGSLSAILLSHFSYFSLLAFHAILFMGEACRSEASILYCLISRLGPYF